jgi:hypothetical protein
LPLVEWSRLDAEMATNIDEQLSLSSLLKGKLFSAVASSSNAAIFLEMMTLRERPLLMYGGFLCLQNKFPEKLLAPTMELVMQTPTPGLPLFAPVYEYLKGQQGRPFMEAFSQVASRPINSSKNYAVLLQALPFESLLKWFSAPDRPSVSATSEASIMDRLLEELDNKRLPRPANISRALESLANTPGIPRAVYILFSDEASKCFEPALESVLTEEAIDRNLGSVAEFVGKEG